MNEKVRFVDELEQILRSTFSRRNSVKCLANSSNDFEFVECPLKIVENANFSHPFASIFLESFEKFHRNYRGASSKTFVYFFVKFSRQISTCAAGESLAKLVDETIRHAEENFCEKFVEISPEFCRKVSRSNPIYADFLLELFRRSIDEFFHLTRVKIGEEKFRLVPFLLFRRRDDEIRLGKRRTIFLDGHLIEDFRHVGFNAKKSMKIRTISSGSSSSSIWLKLMEKILDENQIETIVATGTIDSRLKSRENLQTFENISIRILRLFGPEILLNYLTDVDAQRHVVELEFRLFDDDPSLVQINRGVTLLHDVPTEKFRQVRRHQFEHCLGRFNEIRRTNSFVRGSGKFEEQILKFLSTKKNDVDAEILREIFQNFRDDLIDDETNFIDDFKSKTDAWKTSFHLAKIFSEIDEKTTNDDF